MSFYRAASHPKPRTTNIKTQSTEIPVVLSSSRQVVVNNLNISNLNINNLARTSYNVGFVLGCHCHAGFNYPDYNNKNNNMRRVHVNSSSLSQDDAVEQKRPMVCICVCVCVEGT